MKKLTMTWFQIHSEELFEELQFIGSKYQLSTIKAKIYPDRLFIQDMLNNVEGRWEVVDAESWKQQLILAENSYKRIGLR